MQNWIKAALVALLCLGFVASAADVVVPASEWEAIKAKLGEMDRLKQQVNDMQAKGAEPAATSMVDTAMDSKYGPNVPVTTLKAPGQLQISLLTQIWYYNQQRDNRGFFSDANGNGIVDNNNANDINSFRVRRTELKFAYQFSECFGSLLMIDPSRETAGFPTFPFNQGNYKKTGTGNGQISAGTNQTYTGGLISGNNGAVSAGTPARLLQDAYLTCKNVIPYTDFRVGQFKWSCGDEGVRDSATLDFVERSMIGFQGDNRDLGFEAHASFWGKDCSDTDGRFQVFAGVLNGSGTFYNPGNQQNRSDNNQSKDFTAAMKIRPIWSDCMGKLEMGASYYGGKHGPQSIDTSSYAAVTAATPIKPQCYASKGNVYFSYFFGEWFAKGLWVRGEYGYIRDQQEGSVVAFGNGNLGAGATAGLTQTALRPFTSQGGYLSAGYRFDNCSWKECCPCFLKPFELCARYDQFQNIQVANLAEATKTNAFYTHATTLGLNYYLGERTKIQVNYNFVDLPSEKTNTARFFHDTKSNSLLINMQVAF